MKLFVLGGRVEMTGSGTRNEADFFTVGFSHGLVPRFNDLGEVAPPSLTLIEDGHLKNSLISARTAKEYNLKSNGAAGWEGLRSPEILPGQLSTTDILKALGTGLYVSNLHYLNWSDRPTGRITGMTRYACFWVEQGNIVAPIQNLRFDDSLYNFLGDNLMALTTTQELVPEVETYENRSLGGIQVPGALVEDFTYTL